MNNGTTGADALVAQEATEQTMISRSTIEMSEDKQVATIKFNETEFQTFIGEELVKAQEKLKEVSHNYINEVTTATYSEAGKLFANNDELQTVTAEAPIFLEGDKYEARIERTEIEEVEKENYVPAVKITQSLGSTAGVSSGVKTMASTYAAILASKK